jgi:glycosyltransferase involved in cell wall biosynthesis
MKILHIGSSLHDWGGIERYIVYLTGGLSARGHDVAATCPPDSLLSKRLTTPMHPVGLRSRANLLALVATTRILRRERIEVMHAHFSPDFLTAGVAAKLARTPITVLSRHIATHWSPAKITRLLRLYRHIIPVSEATRLTLEADGVPADRLTTVHSGVPGLRSRLNREEALAKLGLPCDRFWIGFVGRLEPEKGADVLIEACGMLPPAFGAALFGDGGARGTLETQIRKAGLESRVKLLGYMSDVVDGMAGMDVIALPSIWAEAFPFAALEAMSMGKPIIASAVGGLPEQIRHEESGLLAPPGNAEAFAHAIRRCREEPENALRWGAQARDTHAREFTVERFAERIEAVYKRLA